MDFKKILFGFMASIMLITNIHSSQETTEKFPLTVAFNFILGYGMDDPEGLDHFLRENLGTTDITDIVNSRGKTLRQEAELYNANPAIFEVLNKYERISLLNKNPEEFFHALLNETFEQIRKDEALEKSEREKIIAQEIRDREIANIKKYELTNEDTCIVCLEPVTALAKTNIENYITKCCKHFLCKNCIHGMQRSARRSAGTLSCPNCRNNPLNLNPVNINLATEPAIATTVPNATIPAQNV